MRKKTLITKKNIGNVFDIIKFSEKFYNQSILTITDVIYHENKKLSEYDIYFNKSIEILLDNKCYYIASPIFSYFYENGYIIYSKEKTRKRKLSYFID